MKPEPSRPERLSQEVDCLIIGGGPAGLTAATYLARYRRNVLVVDDRQSRARLIPESHNYPGFNSIAGPALLEALRAQAEKYGVPTHAGRVEHLTRGQGGSFHAVLGAHEISAATVLLASGLVDETPDLPGLREAIQQGALRFCPICDGYEAMDERIGVLGDLEVGGNKALFMRTYSRDVTLLPTEDPALKPSRCHELERAGVTVVPVRVTKMKRDGEQVFVGLANGESCEIAVLYPALGCEVRSQIGQSLGADCTELGLLKVDDKQQTSVPGLYAAGDVVSDLHQISVAVGHAAIAATAIHNRLRRNMR